MDEIVVHPINDAPLFLSVKDRQPLAKIIDITNLLVLKTDVAGRDNRGGKRGKLAVRRRGRMHFHLHLSLHQGNTKVGKVPPYFLHQIRRGTTDLNREAIEIEALGHSAFLSYWSSDTGESARRLCTSLAILFSNRKHSWPAVLSGASFNALSFIKCSG